MGRQKFRICRSCAMSRAKRVASQLREPRRVVQNRASGASDFAQRIAISDVSMKRSELKCGFSPCGYRVLYDVELEFPTL
mgnify:CR=1 FL=1